MVIGRGGLVGMGVAALALAAACNAILGNDDKVLAIDAAGAMESGVGEEGGSADDSQSVADSGFEAESVMDALLDTGPETVVDAVPDVVQLPSCPTPTFIPNGGSIPPGTNVTIAAAMLPMNGTIFYTTDGTLATHASHVYSGPIQVTQVSETIRALASAPTCADTPGSATFVLIPPDPTILRAPAFTPTSTTQNNDFMLALSSGSGATICYTLDGVTMPTCSVTATAATCTGNSLTYDATTRISISSGITNAMTGSVTVQAIACQPTFSTTIASQQLYTLQAAPPSMVAPPPGNLAYSITAPTPTISDITMGSTIQYTTDGTTPTCSPGSPGVAAVNPSTIALTANTTINAIACKVGYSPSTVSMSAYTITLTTPAFPAAPTSGAPGTYDAVVPAFTLAVDNSTAWVCLTRDGSVPACGATASTCSTNATISAVAGNAAPVASIMTTGTTMNAVACALTFTPSAAASGTFTLQLDPPDLNPPGLAGGVPGTSYSIPVAGIGPVNVEQDGAGLAYSFACAIQAGMPACGINGCTTGTLINGPFPASLGSTPVAGDVWSVVGCPAPGGAFLPSVVTTVTYSALGAPPRKCLSNLLTPTNAVALSVNNANTASGAVDGNFTTRWESAQMIDPEWIYIDFGSPVFINRVRIIWETACGKDYNLQISNDAATWTTIKSITGNSLSSLGPTDWSMAADHTGLSGVGRYLRIYGTARCTINYGYSIWEMQVYGDPNPPCSP